MSRPLLLLLASGLALGGCTSKASRCEKRCVETYGGGTDSCAEICRSTCEELENQLGISEDACRELKEGE